MSKEKSAPAQLTFQCPRCKAKQKISMDFAGRYAPCAKCKNRIPIPVDQAEADEEMREYGVKSNAYEIPKVCTKCKNKMGKGAVVCINCGFDYRKGKQLTVDDHTIKKGDKVRGGPALSFMIGEIVFLVMNIIWPIYRSTDMSWWELGIVLGLGTYVSAGAVMHFMQWQAYCRIPIRETAIKLIEDRAERDEALEPFGRWTGGLWFLCMGIGIGIGYLVLYKAGPPAEPPKPPIEDNTPAGKKKKAEEKEADWFSGIGSPFPDQFT